MNLGTPARLLPGWEEEIQRSAALRAEAKTLAPLRVDAPRGASRVYVASNAKQAAAAAEMLKAMPLSAVAIDSEFGFDRPGVALRSGKTWNDVRSQQPICISVAAWTQGVDGHIVRVVLDVRRPDVVPLVAEILRLRVPFVCHHVKPELFTLWALGFDIDLPNLYDTYLAAACLHLGRHHKRSLANDFTASEAECLRAEDGMAERRAHLLSLVGQCEHYGLGYPHSESKDALRERFIRLGPGDPLDERLVEYSAADAEWTLRLYAAQQPDVLREGLASHLYGVEFPFAVANARMEWRGVHVDGSNREALQAGARRAADFHASRLRDYGIDPPGSRDRFLAVMAAAGLGGHFCRCGAPSTKDSLLEILEPLHPAIRHFRLHRRYRQRAGEDWIAGSDSRIHPFHHQLGAATGRNTCTTPNIVGIGRAMRPVVTAPVGRVIIELDYGQIEVGVAAAEHGDPDLLAAYNSGDVYASMAMRFYESILTAEERGLAVAEFKARRPDLRDAMKTLVLAILYNIQAPALAARFSLSLDAAESERTRFLDLYPALKRRLQESVDCGLVRGYATVVSGLRRKIERRGRADSWTRNFLRNTPIQGSAAVIFKRAVALLDQAFRGSDTWIILPVHDAVVIECPTEAVEEVAERAAGIMRLALQTFYPSLKPKVEINNVAPSCWNKDGHGDSLVRFLQDPGFLIDQLVPPGARPAIPVDTSETK